MQAVHMHTYCVPSPFSYSGLVATQLKMMLMMMMTMMMMTMLMMMMMMTLMMMMTMMMIMMMKTMTMCSMIAPTEADYFFMAPLGL